MALPINVTCFPLGEWMTNCYVVSVDDRAWIVDAGFAPAALLEHVAASGLTVEKIVLTHAHVDHIAGLNEVRETHPNAPILIHEAEAEFLENPTLNLSAMLPSPIIAPPADQTLTHGDTLTLGDVSFEIRHTPGHSPGGISLISHDNHIAIVGDALFANSIGRYDFPTSDGPTLIKSIHEQLLSLPDETRVMPGHGGETTIGDERANNPYLQSPPA